MYYELVHWVGITEDQGCFEVDLVMVEPETIEALKTNKPPVFIEIMVEDGEKRIIHTDNINCLREVLGDNPQGEMTL